MKRLSLIAINSIFRLRRRIRGKSTLKSVPKFRRELDVIGTRFKQEESVKCHSSWLTLGRGNGPEIKKVPCDIHIPEEKTENVILYFHGGAYVCGSHNSHRSLASRFAKQCHAQVYVVDYRLAPEAPYPAGLDDAEICYRALLDNGISSKNIIVMGDSAGGGLSLALLAKIKSLGLPMPMCACVMSPWSNLGCDTPTYESNRKKEVMLSHDFLSFGASSYMGSHTPSNPFISPVFADYKNFPPLMIQVGSSEILLDDSLQVAKNAKAAGVSVDLRIWDGVIHVWQLMWPVFEPARVAIDEIADYIKKQSIKLQESENSSESVL